MMATGAVARQGRFPKPFTVIAVSAIVTGSIFLSGTAFAAWVFYPLAGTALTVAFVTSLRTRDWLNPVAVLVVSAVLRIGIPVVLVIFSSPPREFEWVVPALGYWSEGLGLSIVGLLSILLGWQLTSASAIKRGHARGRRLARRRLIDKRIVVTASAALAIGALLVIFFLRVNFGAASEAVTSGVVRSADLRVEGTSRYNLLGSQALIYGSTLLTAYLLIARRKRLWIGLAPTIGAALLMTTFGGRVVAATPLVYGLIVAWYRKARSRLIQPSALLKIGVVALVTGYYTAFVVGYRGGGIEAGVDAVRAENLWEYLQFSAWYEFGFLHPSAIAVFLGPGSLDGGTYAGLGGFVTEVFLGMDVTRSGTYMVDSLTGYPNTWGIHSGLTVDLFLNTGLLAVVVGCLLFGRFLRAVYETLRTGRESPAVVAVYAIVLWNAIWIFYESMIAVFPLMLGLTTFWLLILASKLLPTGGPRQARLRQPAATPPRRVAT